MKNIVKIDLCKSKIFTANRERVNPDIRQQVLRKLLDISKEVFPGADEPYPKGSFYKADGDAVYFILEKTSVALRCATVFMQNWYHNALPNYPECRIMIEQSKIKEIDAPGKIELVGKAFDNISVFEKDLGDGQIYVTNSITQNVDRTMTNFSFFKKFEIEGEDTLFVYTVNYLDPRTVADSSLIHALFVANPRATEARNRVIELFLIEYAIEKKEVRNLDDFIKWAVSKEYSVPQKAQILEILSKSDLFSSQLDGAQLCYFISEVEKNNIEKSRKEFFLSRNICIESVSTAIHDATRSDKSTSDIDLGLLIENYLSSIFSEIRMIANYFKQNYQIFQESKDKFEKYDYILKRALPTLGAKYFDEWKTGFITGLANEARKDNSFIAAIFHNVLSIYYLNRSTQTVPYQREKLKTREIYFDTNILYSLLVPASNYHEIVSYIMKQFEILGVRPKVFPFTIGEYEQSLESVQRQCPSGIPSVHLQEKNPWLLQEFLTHRLKYQGSMAVCRRLHSITKGLQIVEDNYQSLNEEIQKIGLQLEPEYSKYSEEQIHELWINFRNLMPSNEWEIDRYWDFIYSDSLRPEFVKSHDVHCIQNLIERTSDQKEDELGLKTFFLTLDTRRLLRLRKRYQFIISPEQFLEFFLPYLFLADIPLIESESFPNKLLSAGLSTLLVSRPLEAVDMLRSFLDDPSVLNSPNMINSETGREMAIALNSERFNEITEISQELSGAQKSEVAYKIADILEKEQRSKRQKYYSDFVDLQQQISEKDKEIKKLRNTVRYWRTQSRNE